MPVIAEAQSSLTDRYQTTIPEAVRHALQLSKRDKITYAIRDNGEVVLARASADDDGVLDAFMALISADIAKNPQHVRPLSADMKHRADVLTADITITFDAPLADETL